MRHVVALALALLVGGPAHAAVVTVSDGTFDDAGWEIAFTSFRSGPGGGALTGGNVLASQIAGGYPGTARSISIVLPPAPGPTEYSSTFGIHLRKGFLYDPMVQGPIATIDYEEDARLPSQAQLTGLGLRQGGQLYFVQVQVFTSSVWTHLARIGIILSNFEHLTADGVVQGVHPDLTASGGPIEVGFLRANSTGNGSSGGTVLAEIDNWTVRLNPPCSSDAECDDGDPCGTEACVSGACRSTPLPCDDGDGCTIDACAAGACTHTVLVCDDTDACTTDSCTGGACANAPISCDDAEICTADQCVDGSCVHTSVSTEALVEGKIDELLAVARGTCAGEPLVKKFGKKLVKKLKKARAKLAAADAATRAALIAKLLQRSETLLAAADTLLTSAVASGLVGPACGAELKMLLDSIRECAAGVAG